MFLSLMTKVFRHTKGAGDIHQRSE